MHGRQGLIQCRFTGTSVLLRKWRRVHSWVLKEGGRGKGCGRYASRGGVNAQHHGGTNYTKQNICEAQYMAVTLPWLGPP